MLDFSETTIFQPEFPDTLWCRLPGDPVFISLGVVTMLIAALLTYQFMLKSSTTSPAVRGPQA